MEQSHFTTRRGFVATVGFGMVSLYLLWAGYGAAPLGFGGHGDVHAADANEAGGHGGGHGAHGGASGMSTEEFRRLAEAFVEQNRLADGSVQLDRPAASVAEGNAHEHHAGHDQAARQDDEGPLDIYLASFHFGYTPSVLRLRANVPYRFRMMALDVTHGASLQLGSGGRIVRLRPGVLVEQEVTFTRAGEYLLYCTVYCGLAHDHMKGRIIVTDGAAT